MPKQHFLSPESGTNFQREVPLFLEKRSVGLVEKSLLAKNKLIRSFLLTEQRLVTNTDRQTDRQTDRHRATANTCASITSRAQKKTVKSKRQTNANERPMTSTASGIDKYRFLYSEEMSTLRISSLWHCGVYVTVCCPSVRPSVPARAHSSKPLRQVVTLCYSDLLVDL